MKLIDADDFMGFMRALEAAGAEYVSFANLESFIDRQPVAYDVENVVKEMYESSQKMSRVNIPHTYYNAIGTRACEAIIRRGGIS